MMKKYWWVFAIIGAGLFYWFVLRKKEVDVSDYSEGAGTRPSDNAV